MSTVKTNFIYNCIFQIVNILVPLITTPYLSRVLGVEGIGQYAYAYSIAYYFSMFVTLGLMNYGNRTIAMTRGKGGNLSKEFWNIYTTQIIAGVIISLAYLLHIVGWKGSSINNLIMYGVVLAECFNITWFFYGIEEFKTTAIRDVTIKVTSLIFIFLFVKEPADLWKYTVIRALSLVISQFSLWPLLLKKISFIRPSIEDIIPHIIPNWVLFIPRIAISIYKTMDKIMLGFMAGEKEVGYYESSEKVIQVPMALITALGIVMMPYMAKMVAEGQDKKKIIGIMHRSEHFMVMVSSLVTFGIIAVAKEFVPLFYGEGYEKCILLFYILLPSCIFLAFADVIRSQYLVPNKMDKEFMLSLFAGALINFVVNVILIRRMQSAGAAIGTLLAECTVCLVQALYVRKHVPIIGIARECLIYVFFSVIMVIVASFVPLIGNNNFYNLIVKVLIAGIVGIALNGLYLLFFIKKKNVY